MLALTGLPDLGGRLVSHKRGNYVVVGGVSGLALSTACVDRRGSHQADVTSLFSAATLKRRNCDGIDYDELLNVCATYA